MGGALSSAASPLLIAELGPALGRLILPSDAPAAAGLLEHLAPVRLELATAVFERAGRARHALTRGDLRGAAEFLGAGGWEAEWERAAIAAALIVRERIDAALAKAGVGSGFPARRLQRAMVTEDEGEGIALRLRAAGAPLRVAEHALDLARTAGGWPDALISAARALESAWLALEESARAEEEAWHPEVARIASWHAARWPRWVAATVIVVLGGYIGLILGGYLPVPAPLAPAAHYWWTRVER